MLVPLKIMFNNNNNNMHYKCICVQGYDFQNHLCEIIF